MKKLLKENMGYLPRVLFFYTFQLGAESKNQVFSSEEASRSIASPKTQIVTIGTLGTPEDDSTCRSLLVALKVLPILSTFCGFGVDTLGIYINFCSFLTEAFSFLNLREEKIEINSDSLSILRF
jgi:hypothetical protein